MASNVVDNGASDVLKGWLVVAFGNDDNPGAIISRDPKGKTVVTAFQSAIGMCRERLAENNIAARLEGGELIVDDSDYTPERVYALLSQG